MFSTPTKAEGQYDGIYSLTPDIGYVTIKEQNGTLVVILNQTVPEPIWNAMMGTLNGSSTRLSSILSDSLDSVNVTIDVQFTSSNSFQAMQVSCLPSYDYDCLLPNGSLVTGQKIW